MQRMLQQLVQRGGAKALELALHVRLGGLRYGTYSGSTVGSTRRGWGGRFVRGWGVRIAGWVAEDLVLVRALLRCWHEQQVAGGSRVAKTGNRPSAGTGRQAGRQAGL